MEKATVRRGAPEKLTLEKVQALVVLHDAGRTFKALAAERHIPYASINAALKRHGLTDKQRKALPVTDVVVGTSDTPTEKVAA